MYDICFIVTPIPFVLESTLDPPMGALSLASYVQQYGFTVCIANLQNDDTIPDAKYYGFSTYTPTYYASVDIAKKLDGITIAGGPHATALPDECANDFDYVVIGEGEGALLNLLFGCNGERIIHNSTSLTSMPQIDYSLVDLTKYTRRINGKSATSLLSSRGCPYNCLFCNSQIFDKYHAKSVDSIIQDMYILNTQHGYQAFKFLDDTFGISLNWMREFADKSKYIYRALTRASQCTPEFVRLLADSGCVHVAIGVESGSDKMLQRMNKQQTSQTCANAIANLRNVGITSRAYFIVGFPGETWETVEETCEFIKQTTPDEYGVFAFVPYPGTHIYEHATDYGIRNLDSDFNRYRHIYGNKQADYIYDLENVNRAVLAEMRQCVMDTATSSGVNWMFESNARGAL